MRTPRQGTTVHREYENISWLDRGQLYTENMRTPRQGTTVHREYEDIQTGDKSSTSNPVAVVALSADCGGQLNSTSGVIVSPGYPSGYPMNVTCAWTITAASSNVIDIRFRQFDTKYTSGGCGTDYVKVYDGSGTSAPLLATVCGKLDESDLASLLIRSTSNKMYVMFRSDSDLVRPGFIAKFWTHACQVAVTDTGAITNPSYPSPYRTNGMCLYDISAPNGKLVFLRIYDINIEECTSCSCDALTIYDGADTTSPVLGRLCGLGDMSDIPGQLWSTSNTMYISFRTDSQNTYRGYYASISFISSDCPSFTWGVTTECTTPCICVQANSISCIRMTGVCVCKPGYYGSDCSSTNPNTAPTIPPCTTNIAAASGVLSSPKYSQNYTNNQLCQWNIVSGTNKFIVLIITDLRMESSPDCSKDYLDIYDGVDAYSNKLGRVCQGPVPSFTSSGNKMYIVMRTDGAGTNTATTESCDSTTGVCKCKTGWTSSDCSQDEDECLQNRCPRPQACLNTLGGYECSFSIGTCE
ncbi:protein tolkin-like [Physella acuta]|uniref:protein tolkin-like n=1 Tax=Physella acuta TaxID=109671 RepID=UPI0027DD4B5F|nr:protein tolkin-like [Physella acuta]